MVFAPTRADISWFLLRFRHQRFVGDRCCPPVFPIPGSLFRGGGNQALALRRLARELTRSADCFAFFSRRFLRWFFVEPSTLHLPEDAFPLHLRLSRPRHRKGRECASLTKLKHFRDIAPRLRQSWAKLSCRSSVDRCYHLSEDRSERSMGQIVSLIHRRILLDLG
jgi:hypothetical protein